MHIRRLLIGEERSSFLAKMKSKGAAKPEERRYPDKVSSVKFLVPEVESLQTLEGGLSIYLDKRTRHLLQVCGEARTLTVLLVSLKLIFN